MASHNYFNATLNWLCIADWLSTAQSAAITGNFQMSTHLHVRNLQSSGFEDLPVMINLFNNPWTCYFVQVLSTSAWQNGRSRERGQSLLKLLTYTSHCPRHWSQSLLGEMMMIITKIIKKMTPLQDRHWSGILTRYCVEDLMFQSRTPSKYCDQLLCSIIARVDNSRHWMCLTICASLWLLGSLYVVLLKEILLSTKGCSLFSLCVT